MILKPLAAGVICLAATVVCAEETTEWKTVGDWKIVVDKVTRGCIMEKFYDNGFLLQFGFLPDRDAGFFAAYRQDWLDVQHGRPVTVKFLFDGEEFTGPAQGYIAKPWYGGFAKVNNPLVVYEFAKKHTMTIKGPKAEFELSLDGTLDGVKELEACQMAQMGG
ncbi:MAG: hypothetical protein ACWA5A_03930 [Marinibacterium sp.]